LIPGDDAAHAAKMIVANALGLVTGSLHL